MNARIDPNAGRGTHSNDGSVNTDRMIYELLDKANEQASKKADYIAPAQQFQFNQNADMVVTNAVQSLFGDKVQVPPMSITDHAFKQACIKLGKAVFPQENKSLPADYLLAIQPEIRAINMNDAIKHMPSDSGWTVRTYENTVRAVMSEDYMVMDNHEMLDLLAQVLRDDNTPHRVSRQSFVEPDAMNVHVLYADVKTNPDKGGNGNWSIGVGLRNGEIGQWKWQVYPVVKRTSCDNSIAVDREGLAFASRHFGKATRVAKLAQMKSAMIEILPFGQQVLNKMLEADYKEMPNFEQVIEGLGLKFNWSDDVAHKVWSGTENVHTHAGIVNGITYAAQALTPVDRTDMEFLGGRILMEPGSLFDEAVRLVRNKTEREEAALVREQAKEQRRAARATRATRRW